VGVVGRYLGRRVAERQYKEFQQEYWNWATQYFRIKVDGGIGGLTEDRHDLEGRGSQQRISPHSLRHTHVTQLLDAGRSLCDVQIGEPHADPRITMGYDRARL